MKQLFLLGWLCWCAIPAMAQNKKAPYKKHLILSGSMGVNAASKNMTNGTGTDVFIPYQRTNVALQALRAECFLKHFGIYAQIRLYNMSQPSTAERRALINFFLNDLGRQYYLLNEPGIETASLNFNKIATKGAIGLLYRWENHRFYVSGGLGLSLYQVAVYEKSFPLKEKDANAYFEVKYAKRSKAGDTFGIPSLDLGVAYKPVHWFWFKADAAWSTDRYHFSIDKTITNINTQAIATKESVYKGSLSNYYFGLGFALAF
ncbi:MAG: hypothetical protein BGO31_06610 [Bacteroidetes bacterium 43-16]|nr:MAG: hypothetical protein BGO31_06610 [Bacteroidetes bacterium 43-16]